jgi:hypothetical protein
VTRYGFFRGSSARKDRPDGPSIAIQLAERMHDPCSLHVGLDIAASPIFNELYHRGADETRAAGRLLRSASSAACSSG